MNPSTSVSTTSPEVLMHIQVYIDLGKPDGEHIQALEKISSEVSQKNVTMQELILALGSYLTGDDEKQRGQATLLLVEVCNSLSVDPIAISSNSIKHLAIFFRNRLSDFPSLLASMKGLELIVTHHSNRILPREDFIREIAKSMSEVNVQSLSQSYRMVAYRVYMAMLTNPAARECLGARIKPDEGGISAIGACSDEEDQISLEFVDAVISAVDGERDPRSLVVSLQLISTIFKHHHRTVFTFPNKFFDIISCYFPITFTPPPDDPHGITSEDLIRLLEDCLCGHEALMDRLIPFMKHKLKNDIFHGKVQAMSCIARACHEYGPSVFLRERPSEIADCLFELAQGCTGQNEEAAELASTAFRCMKSIVKDISMKFPANNDEYSDEREGWNGLIEPLIKQTEIAMKAPTSSTTLNGKAAIQVACAISSGSFIASKAVIERMLPLLSSHLPTGSVHETHLLSLPSILVHINLLIASLRASGLNFSGMGTIHPVATHGPPLLRILVSFLRSNKYSMISQETTELTAVTSAVVREAARCLKELFTQLPSPESLQISTIEMLALMSCISDISIYGQGALMGSHLLPVESYADLPARTVVDTTDALDINNSTSGENNNDRNADGCCGGSHNHGDCNSNEHNGTKEGEEESAWSRRIKRQKELESSNSNSSGSSSAIDITNILLQQSAIDVLCQLSKTLLDDNAILSRIQEPVNRLLIGIGDDNLKMFEQCVTVLSSVANQCKFGKDNEAVFISMLEPLLSQLANIVSKSGKNEIFTRQIGSLLTGIKHSISNGNVSAQKIKLFVTSSKLKFLTYVTNVLGSIDDASMSDVVISKYSELLQELVSRLPDELLDEFHTSVLECLYEKKVQNLRLLDLISVLLSLAALSKSCDHFYNGDSRLFYLIRRMAEFPPEEISLSCFQKYMIVVALFINKASWPLADIVAKAALESCISSLAKNFDQKHLSQALCKYLMLICRSILMRTDNSINNLSPTACELIDSSGEIKSMYLNKWHEVIIAILLQTISSCVFRDDIAMACMTLTTDMNSVFIANKCNMTILWKQKIWSSLFLGLEKQLKCFDEEGKGEDVSHLLLTMNSIIQNMPNGIIENNTNVICTLCVRAFSTSTDNIELRKYLQAIAIENIYKFIGDALNENIKNHINTIAPACVDIAQNDSIAKMRCMALECLLQMSRLYPYHKLFPVKKVILKGLQKVVDDKKRAIRILAAKVRNEYSVLSTGGG